MTQSKDSAPERSTAHLQKLAMAAVLIVISTLLILFMIFQRQFINSFFCYNRGYSYGHFYFNFNFGCYYSFFYS